ncbi:hypothetical protein [Arthrobacter wenxiniae]|uniref:Uncharacterized protein n=1 Tax=Arthrobacter wenxiniae TaxID=2713570 RepID=A0A7Y7IJL9_9MICC|nr:hypothetical protein [Arthrobacter wenxiniae]NVM96091.1 hypothetical protein [Arthrobacter wenxiniae]
MGKIGKDKDAARHLSSSTEVGNLKSRLTAKLKAKVSTPLKPLDVVQHYERQQALRERLLGNVTALVSVAVFVFVVLKVLLIADSNVSTALSVVKEAGPIQVVAGVLIIGLPFIGTGLANTAGILARTNELNRYEQRRLWTYYFGSVFVLSFVLSWWSLIAMVAFPLFSLILWRKERKAPAVEAEVTWEKFLAQTPEDSVLRDIVQRLAPIRAELNALGGEPSPDAVRLADLTGQSNVLQSAFEARMGKIRSAGSIRLDALAITLLITTIFPVWQSAMSDQPWLPAENITLASGKIEVGYVVSTSDGWSTILIDKPRLVERLHSAEILARETCVTADSYNSRQTVWSFSAPTMPTYPRCSK